MVKTAQSVQTMFAMIVSVMTQTVNEIKAWNKFRKTPGMNQIWTHCDLFCAFGIGLTIGLLMGLTFTLCII